VSILESSSPSTKPGQLQRQFFGRTHRALCTRRDVPIRNGFRHQSAGRFMGGVRRAQRLRRLLRRRTRLWSLHSARGDGCAGHRESAFRHDSRRGQGCRLGSRFHTEAPQHFEAESDRLVVGHSNHGGSRVLRVMLQTRWSAEAWLIVRVEFRRALALRSEIRRARHVGSPPPTYAELSRSRFGGCCWVPGGNGGSGRRGTSGGSTCGGCWPLTPHVRRPPRMRWGGRLICYPGPGVPEAAPSG